MTTPRWQFSIRGILFFTAIVSGILAFAVRMPAFFQIVLISTVPICVLVGIFQGANFATSDSRPRMAVIAWSLLGLFFALFSSALLCVFIQVENDSRTLPTLLIGICVMGGCFAVCVSRVFRAYGLISAPAAESNIDVNGRTYAKDQR